MNREGLDMGDLVNFFDYSPRYHTKPTEPAVVIILPIVVIDRGLNVSFYAAARNMLERRIAEYVGMEPFIGPAP